MNGPMQVCNSKKVHNVCTLLRVKGSFERVSKLLSAALSRHVYIWNMNVVAVSERNTPLKPSQHLPWDVCLWTVGAADVGLGKEERSVWRDFGSSIHIAYTGRISFVWSSFLCQKVLISRAISLWDVRQRRGLLDRQFLMNREYFLKMFCSIIFVITLQTQTKPLYHNLKLCSHTQIDTFGR